MNRRTMLRLTAFTAVSALTGHVTLPALAQQKLVLKASDVHPLGYPTVEAVVRMGKALEAGSGGRLSIQMYPAMQLGGEKEMIEQAQVGALAIARVSVGPMGPMVPELNVFNLPFMFRDDAHMEKVIDGEIGSELLKKLTDHPTSGLVGLCWMNAGTRHVYNSKKPIKGVEDLKGLKIRMMGNQVFVDTMNALGGNGVAMGFDQLVSAMQTGVVDGAENNYPSTTPVSISPGQVLFADRPPHDSRNPGVLEADLGNAPEERSGPDHAVGQSGAARAAQALVRDGGEVDQAHAGGRYRDQQDHRPQAIPGGGQTGLGQACGAARRVDQAHPGREVSLP
jgi:tripartite ATP-independent transporter DctP family solute receptor